MHIYYAAKFKNPQDPKFAAGSETLEVRVACFRFVISDVIPLSLQGALFHPDDIPWANMAFPTGKAALKHYLKCIKEGGVITPLQRVFREPEPK